jgi:hypothetical protein
VDIVYLACSDVPAWSSLPAAAASGSIRILAAGIPQGVAALGFTATRIRALADAAASAPS